MDWNFLHRLVTFLLIPVFFISHIELPAVSVKALPVSNEFAFWQEPSHTGHVYTFDDVLRLLDEIENGDLENCDLATLNRIAYMISVLAQNGILPDEDADELQRDLQELLYDESYYNHPYLGTSSYCHAEIFLCKSWVHKKWDKIKKVYKKHKKAVIIGAAVVVAVVVTVGVAAAVTAAGAAAGAATRDDEHGDSRDDHKHKSHHHKTDHESHHTPEPPPPDLKTTLDDHIETFKELIVEEGLVPNPGHDTSIAEQARELGSFLAHETFEGVAKLASVAPQLMEEIRDVGSAIIPQEFQVSGDLVQPPLNSFESLVASGHQHIDQIFSTNQADFYSLDDFDEDKYTLGIIPPPGSLSNVGRLAATEATEVCGWQLGEDMRNRTIFGSVPKWSTVRRRYWRNQAHLHPENYEEHELQRMREGLAPQRYNAKGELESKELHHRPPQREGGLFDFEEVWPEEHANLDEYRHLGN